MNPSRHYEVSQKFPRLVKGALSCFSVLTLMASSSPAAFASSTISHEQFQTKHIVLNGTTLSSPDGFVSGGTTYMPIWYVMQALNNLGYLDTWNGKTWGISTPFNIAIKSATYGSGSQSIILNNTVSAHVNAIYATDPQSGKVTTYMPIWYVMQLVKAAGVTITWNGTTWTMSTQAVTSAPVPPVVPAAGSKFLMFMSGDDASIADVQDATPNVTDISPSGFYLNASGTIGGSPSQNAMSYAQTNHLGLTPRIACSDSSVMDAVFGNATTRQTAVNSIMALISRDNLSGVTLDFELVPPSQRDNFTAFLQSLYSAMHPAGKSLSIALPAVTNPVNETWDDGYDFQAIGQTVDNVIIMAYDYSYPGGQAGPIAPVWWVNKVAQYATSQIPSSKVLLGIDTYAYDWSNGGNTTAHSLSFIDSQVQSLGLLPRWDAADEAPYYTYNSGGRTDTVYYENAQSTAAKLTVAKQLGLGGIAVWRAGLEDSAVAATLRTW